MPNAAQPDISKAHWIAQPKQEEFLHQKTYEALYGGAAGGGKSDALLAFSIARRIKYPKSKGLILRRTIEELRKEGSLIPRSFELLHGKWRWVGSEKKWIAPNGSVIEFGYCKYEKDVYQYQSAQYDDICIDELTHWTEFQYEYLKSRARSARGIPVGIRCATNPGNIGHAWVKKRFVTICPPGQIYSNPNEFYLDKNGNKVLLTRVFIPAKIYDNKVLMEKDPGYIARLDQLPENERRALKDGDWDVFKGQYFYDWRYNLHVCKPFKIPQEWNRYITIDWGMAKPMAVYWIALAPEKRAYIYKELYTTGLISSQAAQKIVEMSDVPLKQIRYITADPSVFSRKGEGTESIGSTMMKAFKAAGHPKSIIPAKHERVNGWMRVREWFDIAPDGKPWLQVFENCENFWRTIPDLIYDENDVEDLDSDGEDHAADSFRYWAVTNPRPKLKEPVKPYDTLPEKDKAFWERWEHDQKNRAGKKGVKEALDIL